jgi:hypothetical protein
MRRTNLPGHALRSEGAAYYFYSEGKPERVWSFGTGRGGFALCECGETSPVLESAAARKRWHSAHKDAVRGAFDGAPGHG